MKMLIEDRKTPFALFFWSKVNNLVIGRHFRKLDIDGQEAIPDRGSFLLVSNHLCRWDGLLLAKLIGRASNFLVSPNELLGLQGLILRSVGAFPANPRYDLGGFVEAQARKGQPLIIFPEGDIFRDGTTHSFKNGAARMALSLASKNIELPVIPVALAYPEDVSVACLKVGAPVCLEAYLSEYEIHKQQGIRSLSIRLHREICGLQQDLGTGFEQMYRFKKARFWGLKPQAHTRDKGQVKSDVADKEDGRKTEITNLIELSRVSS